jgi:hypothetical protein
VKSEKTGAWSFDGRDHFLVFDAFCTVLRTMRASTILPNGTHSTLPGAVDLKSDFRAAYASFASVLICLKSFRIIVLIHRLDGWEI